MSSVSGVRADVEDVGRELLEAISHAMRVLEGGGDEEDALRESFRMASRGLGSERSFLARLNEMQWVTDVVESEGLEQGELKAVRAGLSAPGLSLSLVRQAAARLQVEHLEDTRLARLREMTGSLRNGEWSVVCAPILDVQTRRSATAVLYFQTHSLERPLRATVVPHVRSYAWALACTWHAWRHARREVRALRRELTSGRAIEILGVSPATVALRRHLDTLVIPAMASARPDPILIQGETGTGKGVVARYLHSRSRRARGPFVSVNSATLKGDLAEKALFGHLKGSYTGALSDGPGAFVSAHRGVLFLDEVGDMSAEGQALLLHATETGHVRPVGGTSERAVDVQLIFATHVDLLAAQRAGRFRADLYHRISALPVRIEPLRERAEDVLVLAQHMLEAYERERGRATLGFSGEALALLKGFPWPGNVRQLEKVCHRLSLRTPQGEAIEARAVQAELALIEREGRSDAGWDLAHLLQETPCAWSEVVVRVERWYLRHVGQVTGWNRSAMARWLKLDRKSLYRRLHRCGLMGQEPAQSHAGGAEDGDEHED
jgi:two-component system response regulator PilR (NtrC family)